MPRARKLVPLPEDVVEELAVAARRMGLSLTEVLEIILRNTIHVVKTRDDVNGFLVEAVMRGDMHRLGGIMVPLKVLLRLLRSVSDEERERVLKETADYARLIVRVTRARGFGGIQLLKLLLRTWIPSSIIEVNYGDDGYQLIISSQSLEDEVYRRLLVDVVKAVVTELGMEVKELHTEPGVVTIRFITRGVEGESR